MTVQENTDYYFNYKLKKKEKTKRRKINKNHVPLRR